MGLFTPSFYVDLLERSLWTFIQGFLAVWIVTGSADWSDVKVGLIAGGIAVGKCLLAVNIGRSDSASTHPRL